MAGFVGYRFHPTPQELIGHYLMKKRVDPAFSVHKIRDFNIYGYEPSELPKIFPVQPDEQEWYFFCKPNYIYANSKRVNRKTRGGNWKVTGKKRDIKDKREKKVIGWKITLVFYEGSGNSKEARTNWVMHEYHMENDPLFKSEFVVIRIRRNPDIKHDNTPSNNECIPSPNVISSSENHYSENIELQAESDSRHLPSSNPPLPNPNPDNFFINGIQNISSNYDNSFNNKFQSSLLNYDEFQELSSNYDIFFNNEFQPSSLNYSEFQTDPSNYNSQEDQLKNSVDNEFYGQVAREIHPHNFNRSTLITGAHVCDSISNDAEAEIIAAELSFFDAIRECDFSSMANGEYYYDRLCQRQSYPALDENILPLQMGSVV